METQKPPSWATPIAIIMAGLLVAGAIYYRDTNPNTATNPPKDRYNLAELRPVDIKTDHIRGDAKAKVTVIEYSDLECPFCKILHQSMLQIKRQS